MSDDLKIVTVPRDLYYHEIAYVRGLEADNARLRAVLQSLTTDPPATLDEPDTDAEVIIKMRAIARAAREPKP